MLIVEDLLTPIPGENPSGANLRYEPIFQQLKTATTQEDQGGVFGGDFETGEPRKIDHRSVVRMAGEALEKRSKDIQLAAYLTASILHVEGFAVAAPCIDLLRQLQESFWPTIYPEPDDGEDYEFRSICVEKAAQGIAQSLTEVPLTSKGLTYLDYLESRAVGYEKDATGEAKREARKDAIERGKLTAEEFDKAFANSPKQLYLDAEAALAEALQAVDRLDEFQREAYKGNEPNLRKLRETVDAVHRLAASLLNERRKTEPDPVAKQEAPQGETGAEEGVESAPVPTLQQGLPVFRPRASGEPLASVEDAWAQVVESALYLFEQNPASPVPYLVCAGLRTGETAMQGETPEPGFAVAPSAEVRVLLRNLANSGNWAELLKQSLPVLASDCARAWLDLHRHIWRAGQETGAPAISNAVEGTIRSLLTACPQLRYWTLEDDTGAANPETQRWLEESCRV